MRTILIPSEEAIVDPRTISLKGLAERLSVAEGDPTDTSLLYNSPEAAFFEVLSELDKVGALINHRSQDGIVTLNFAPTWAARQAGYKDASSGTWDVRLAKKLSESFRPSKGALFRFPVEGCEGHITAFITDWSPFPAATALALYKEHPVSRVARIEGSGFTGVFVRHPLTADLLPVWVAPWVRPGFGTGAVVVNPAHDATDLAFAQQVGLPIRFGLVPQPVTGDPATWPEPPIIKSGITTRTGRFDGLTISEAAEVYVQDMIDNGFAELAMDYVVGTYPLASLHPSPESPFQWCAACQRLLFRAPIADTDAVCTLCNGVVEQVHIEPTRLLRVFHESGQEPFRLFCHAAEVERILLFLNLLWHDVRNRAFQPANCQVYQRTNEFKGDILPEDLNLAALIAGPLDQVAVLKPQILDQVRAFRSGHAELFQTSGQLSPSVMSESSLSPDLSRIKKLILAGQPNQAFASLYNLQKNLRKMPSDKANSLLPAFFTLSYVLTEYAPPEGIDPKQIWAEIP